MKNNCPSPDGKGNPFVATIKASIQIIRKGHKRLDGQREIAPKKTNYDRETTNRNGLLLQEKSS